MKRGKYKNSSFLRLSGALAGYTGFEDKLGMQFGLRQETEADEALAVTNFGHPASGIGLLILRSSNFGLRS